MAPCPCKATDPTAVCQFPRIFSTGALHPQSNHPLASSHAGEGGHTHDRTVIDESASHVFPAREISPALEPFHFYRVYYYHFILDLI